MRLDAIFLVILFCIIISTVNCKDDNSTGNDSIFSYPEFIDEIEVIINDNNADAMEPFISKDGNYLFFNSLNDGVNTTLYYATKVNEAIFDFKGELSGANGTPPHLDAVASMDNQNKFYFVSTRNYPTVFENYQFGNFNTGAVTNIQPVKGDFYIYSPGWLIMDAEINKEGNLLYYVNAKFSGQALPDEAKLGIAEKQDSLFKKITSNDNILKNINDTNFIIYAPSISLGGKELYFTRIKKGTPTTEICVSVRSENNGVFSIPKGIEISGNAIEAPTLTDDGKRIYYHKKLTSDNKYHIYTMRKK